MLFTIALLTLVHWSTQLKSNKPNPISYFEASDIKASEAQGTNAGL